MVPERDSQAGDGSPVPHQAATGSLGGRRLAAGAVHRMSSVLEPTDSGRRDRAIALDAAHGVHRPTGAAPAPAAPGLLHFDRVSKWYGPVIGVNQVTLQLQPGITGLVG